MVHPFGDDQSVPKGDWITHTVAWLDSGGGDSTKGDIQRWLDSVVLEYYVDGERIEDAKQYYGDVQQTEDGYYITRFRYTTPPKDRGEHTFTIRNRYPDGFEDTDTDAETRDTVREPGDVTEFTGTYFVEGRSTRDE